MANNKFVTLEALKSTTQRVQTEWLKAIAATGHAHFEKVETVPDAGTAKENVLYLVLNKKTQHYDIYAKVEGAVVLLDDTTVDLTGYATKEQLEAGAKLFDELTGVMGLLYNRKQADTIPAEVTALVEQRQAARKAKDFAEADRLRDKIAALGYAVRETRQGTEITKIDA